ncbi:deiodinase-like protein [Massilia sp. H6]|uniref:TlpA family protein disulfide reductase n=1 Tax=Massilia sp. H6 TaxID=2970464 RepID=UPI002167655B|nr:deiodinase-like protein [Massilia sp. H6]UVW28776.1 redoxin family protein [Massilia sp. H6]
MTSVSQYRYDHVTRHVLMDDMTFSDKAPRPGERIPQFDLPLAGGGRVNTTDASGRKPMLLVTGSLSCPMTASSNPMLKEMHQEFGRDIDFVMLQVREAHPGEYLEQPQSLDEKIEHARQLQQRDALPFPIAIDDVDGSVHQALDGKPNSVWLIDANGTIVYRALWVGDEAGLEQALDAAVRGVSPPLQESTRRLAPMAMGIGKMQEMTTRSGPRAQLDMWRAAPPMAAISWIAGLYQPLPPKWRTIAAVGTVAVVMTAVMKAKSARRNNR